MSAFGGFKNAVVAGVKLIREAIQSPNYVTGVSGWTINKDGTVEFSDAIVRGLIELIALNGSKLILDPGTELLSLYPTLFFHNQAGSNFSFINSTDDSDIGGEASLGLNGGLYIPFIDEIPRRNRLYLRGSPTDASGLRLEVIESASQTIRGGYVIADYESVKVGSKVGTVENNVILHPTGIDFFTSSPADSTFIERDGKSLLPNSNSNTTLGPIGTTNVAVYANAPGSLVNFTKRFNDTILKVALNASCWANGGSAEVRFAISVNGGVDNEILRFTINNAGQHVAVPQGILRFAGINAGAVTVQGRWKRQLGTGTVTIDATDTLTVDVSEVAP